MIENTHCTCDTIDNIGWDLGRGREGGRERGSGSGRNGEGCFVALQFSMLAIKCYIHSQVTRVLVVIHYRRYYRCTYVCTSERQNTDVIHSAVTIRKMKKPTRISATNLRH